MCITTRATTTKVIYKVDHKAAVYKMVYNIERVNQTERVVKIKSQLKAWKIKGHSLSLRNFSHSHDHYLYIWLELERQKAKRRGRLL